MTKENTQSLKAKRPKFLERFATTEQANSLFCTGFIGACCVCVFLITIVVKTALLPQPKYYVPGSITSGIAYPNEIPEGLLIGFSSQWVLNLMNFSPLTIDQVHSRAQKFMTPRFYSDSRHAFSKENEKVHESNIFSIFSLTKDPEVVKKKNVLVVIVEGTQELYMGKARIKTVTVKYMIFLESLSATDTNPYGLFVDKLNKEEITTEEIRS